MIKRCSVIVALILVSCQKPQNLQTHKMQIAKETPKASYVVNPTQILLFDNLDGQSLNLVDNTAGKISANTTFVPTKYNKGFLSGEGVGNRCITYKGEGNFNPLQGTLELWVQIGDKFAKNKHNEHLATLKIDDNNCIGLYYNFKNNALMYWIKDADTPGQNIHQKELNTFMGGPVLDWHAGERHHIAITWQKDHTLMYIDGISARWQNYRGQLYAKFNKNSKIEIARDSNFIIDAIRIWNNARAPRRLDKAPSLADANEVFSYKTHPKISQLGSENTINNGNTVLAVAPATGLPSILADKQKKVALIWGKSDLFFNKKKIQIDADVKYSANQITGSLNLINEPVIKAHSKYIRDQKGIKLELILENTGDKVWKKDVTITFDALTKDSMGFMALSGAPFNMVDGVVSYCGTKQGNQVVGSAHPSAYIPMATVYQSSKDYGFTITEPMDTPDYLTIDFGHDFPSDQLAMINRDVLIKANSQRVLTYYITVHAGDWRAGLKFVNDKFPKTFQSVIKDNSKVDGGMVIGTRSDKAFLDGVKGTIYREISVENHDQVVFGNWVPDKPNRKTLKFYDQLYNQIDDLHRANVAGLLYIQARECKKMDMAKERFAESLLYNSKGEIITSYGFGAKMTCVEGSAWFKHLVSQSKAILTKIPNGDGFFFDNSWDKKYAKVIDAVAKVAHDKGLFFVTNGGSSNSAGSADAIMIEGTLYALRGLAYLGLAQPVTFVPINHYNSYGIDGPAEGVIDNFQADLKGCLLYGAYYGYNWGGTKGFGEESKKIYQDYLPLEANLKGKKWYLVPHALQVPNNVKANIFENGKGELITYITSEGYPFRGDILKPFTVSVRVPNRAIKQVLIRRIEDSKETPVAFKRNGDRIEIEVVNHSSITMLKFK